MNRKGQYSIVEHTILIGVGIAIALGFLAAFQALGDDIKGGASTMEAQLLSQFVAANAIDLMESGSEGRYTVELPDEITSDTYAIRMTDDGVEVVSTGIVRTASLYGLQRKNTIQGSVVSRTPVISLIYAGDELSLEGEQ